MQATAKVPLSALALACAMAAPGCKARGHAPATSETGEAHLTSATEPRARAEPVHPEPREIVVEVETVEVPGDLPVLVVRAARDHDLSMLFLGGMCSHPAGYVQAFARAAAAHGDLVALQGDDACGGDGSQRRWGRDLGAIDRRVSAAFAAADLGEPHDVVVIGYSQGAARAEHLAARSPDKYTSAVLMATPIRPSPSRLDGERAVVLMSGTHDLSKPRMEAAAPKLRGAGVPSTFIELPGAHHGELGEEPERTMNEALDFIAARGMTE